MKKQTLLHSKLKRSVLFATLSLAGAACDSNSAFEEETHPPAINSKVDALSGENLAASNLGGANLAGNNLSAANLAGSNLGGTNLAATNLAGTNLAASNLAGTNLAGSNLAGTNLAASNLAGTNLAGTNLAGTNLAGTNLAGSNLSGTNLAATNLAGSNLAATNLAGTNLAATNAGLNIHGLASAKGMLKSGEDVYTRANACAVMGIGSVAFPRLLNANSGDMKALIGPLPWTLKMGSNASLNAWEAIVWGNNTYCVFVLTVPADATHAGVSGFIKALFRWSAPPSRNISIGAIGGGQTVTTHSGMMNAGAVLMSGRITDKTFIAGETAFISATTNNETVKVDFSTWVRGVNNETIILGNVDSVTRPAYAEGAFTAIDGDNQMFLQFRSADDITYSQADPTRRPTDEFGVTSQPTALDQGVMNSVLMVGTAPAPVAKRCSGAKYLYERWSRPIPAGKCDTYLKYEVYYSRFMPYSQPASWSSLLGSQAVTPYNNYMRTAYTVMDKDAMVDRAVLSETYVHQNELPYR